MLPVEKEQKQHGESCTVTHILSESFVCVCNLIHSSERDRFPCATFSVNNFMLVLIKEALCHILVMNVSSKDEIKSCKCSFSNIKKEEARDTMKTQLYADESLQSSL